MADKKISALTAASTPLAGTEVLPIVQSGATVKVSAANITAGRAVSMASLSAVGNGAAGTQTLATFNAAADAFSNSVELALEPLISGQTSTCIGAQREGVGTGAAVYLKAGGNEVLRGTVAGNISVATGNVVMATAAKGIDFSANTHAAGMTSELLNDYEEGVISIGATCDSGTITLSSNTLYYTKIGRMVHVTGSIVVGSVSSPTGNVYFGLPIAAGISTAVTLYMSNTNTIVGKIPVGVINAGQSIFYIQTLDQTTGNIGGAASIFKAGTEFTFSASYI